MSVSVLIPSYNHAPFVERTLDSIYKQTLHPKELIVIDDGSKDESAQIIEKKLKDCPFPCELIVRENRGLCATLNQGFSLSKGEFFAYISSDDIWLPNFLESRLNVLNQRKQALLAYGHSFLINEKDEIFDKTENWGEYVDGKVLQMLLTPRIPASAAILYRRSTLEKVRWNENSVLEDFELYLRLSALGEFALDKNTLSAWRIHDYNTSKKFEIMMNEWISAIERNATEIGLEEKEIPQITAKIKFNSIQDFIRMGEKQKAFQLLKENSSGASSNLAIGKLLFRLLIPHNILLKRRELERQKAIEKYGVIKV
ncbi:MAG: glycosyltransferase family 2 protein [Pyrinomonadaceae bacterium]|jgi:alpha-1,3-rhamnosyltransferase|nr:glycosyltransferase family 2 protein [Pyrinomonadaceae bacterium]